MPKTSPGMDCGEPSVGQQFWTRRPTHAAVVDKARSRNSPPANSCVTASFNADAASDLLR